MSTGQACPHGSMVVNMDLISLTINFGLESSLPTTLCIAPHSCLSCFDPTLLAKSGWVQAAFVSMWLYCGEQATASQSLVVFLFSFLSL